MSRIFCAAIVIGGLVLTSVSLGYSGGSGTPEDPYQIATAGDLNDIGNHPEDWDKHFILVNNVNLAAYTGTQFRIIGNSTTKFTGVFDGNDHKVSNFNWNSSGKSYIGLFGYVDTNGQIKNIEMENVSIDAVSGNFVGGLAGWNKGSIINCCVTGSIQGSGHLGGLVGYHFEGSIINCSSAGSVSSPSSSLFIGGFVGYNRGSIVNCCSTSAVNCVSGSSYVGGLAGGNIIGCISQCYSTGTVTISGYSGADYVGGLVGCNNQSIISNCYSSSAVFGYSDYVGGLVGYNGLLATSSISNCYSAGEVNGWLKVGGLVGYNDNASTISNCYSIGVVSGHADLGGLVGYNNSGSIISSYFLFGAGPDNGYGQQLTDIQMKQQGNFIGWDFHGETANGTCNYWQMPPGAYPKLTVFYGLFPPELPGSGTNEDPYIIADAYDLGTVGYRPLAHYVLAGDINISGITWSVPVVPVFDGVLDGNGFNINNLFINGGSLLGLFGMLNRGNQIKNLGLENCTIIGTTSNVGGLVGFNYYGDINNCYVTGNVNGPQYTGGLVGVNYGSFKNCRSTGTISGDSGVGGLVGRHYNSNISNCSSTANVSGTSNNVGGLVGENWDGSISYCCSTGAVTGASNVGGLLGGGSHISNCYSSGSVTGTSYIGGLLGNGSYISNSYSTGSVNGTSYVGGLVGYEPNGNISSCYFLVTSGPDNGYGQPLTNEQMKQQASFIDWDFTTIWAICEATNYPRLRWQITMGDFVCPEGIEMNDLAILCEQWLLKELSADVWPYGGDWIVNFFDWAVFAKQWQITVDYEGLADFADQWLKTGTNYYIADIAPHGGDGIVSMPDFAAFANNWLKYE